MLEVQYSRFFRILNSILLKSLVEGDLKALCYGSCILPSQSNRVARSAAVSAPLALEDHVAGHAIVIDSGVAGCVQFSEDLPVRQECGREELQSDISRISPQFRHFCPHRCIGILFNLALPYDYYV